VIYLAKNGICPGYAVPDNIQHYALYLDSRIRAYHDLKHDAVRVQSESNRDMRNSHSIEEDTRRSRGNKKSPAPSLSGPTRSKTIMGRKLRVMTVEKGLLRETKAVHRMIDAVVECRVRS
jgi:phosphatidylinositol-binding clathrin assembly protein